MRGHAQWFTGKSYSLWFYWGTWAAYRQFRDFSGWYAAINHRRWHCLLAVYSPFRIGFVVPYAKPDYRRLYLGWLEIEWSFR